MKKIYIYPNINNPKYTSANPYISNLYNAINPHCIVVNKNSIAENGIFDLLKYLNKLNYVWFNWVEDIPDKKGGLIQTIALICIVLYSKITSKKIIWTLHNRFSHYKKNRVLKKFLFWFLMKNSDHILTHSNEGVAFASSFGKNVKSKARFMHHPLTSARLNGSAVKTTDILIWGSIIPYKGIDVFLEHLRSNKLQNKWKIKIVGKISDKNYEEKIMRYANENTIIENKFIDSDTLKKEISNSKCVLYTYLQNSVLSSGAVMDSIVMGANIIGPRCAAFLDLYNDGLIETYSGFDELTHKLYNLDALSIKLEKSRKLEFIENNSWEKFAEKVSDWLNFKN